MTHNSKLLFSVLAGCALLAVLARPALATTPPAVQKWESVCISSEKAGAEQNWANQDLDKKDGWNPVLKRYGDEGWEPVEFLYTPRGNAVPVINAVCFKRPLR